MRLREYWYKRNQLSWSIFWHVVLAVIVALLVAVVNPLVTPYENILPDFLGYSAQDTQSLLLTLAGALLTITIFLYSTTVLVLTTYSAQFTPRAIENFSYNHSISQVFGTFIGGTVYCVVSLFFISRNENDVVFLVTGVAVIYILVCIIRFIMFIVTVSGSVQVQNLLYTLTKQASKTIDNFIDARESGKRIDSFSTESYEETLDVHARGNGFFEENDVDQINHLLRKQDCLIVLYPRIGDFVSMHQLVARVYHNGLNEDSTLANDIADAFVLEDKRYIDNDYRFTIQKIVEVALKALSASINDPNTAIYSIRHLGVLSGRLSSIEGRYVQMERTHGSNHVRIIDQDFIFGQDLRDIFMQIIHYGKGDVYVMVAVLEALYTAWLVSSDSNREAILSLVNLIFTKIDGQFTHPIEQKMLDDKKQLFELT